MSRITEYFGDGELPWYIVRLRRILDDNAWIEVEFKADAPETVHEMYVIKAERLGWRLVIVAAPNERRRWETVGLLKDPLKTARAQIGYKETYQAIRGSLVDVLEIWEKGEKV